MELAARFFLLILDLVIRQIQAISMALFSFTGFCSGFMYVIANVGEFLEDS